MGDGAEDFFRQVVEAVQIGVYETTGDGCLLRANDHFAALFGYPNADAILAQASDVGAILYRHRHDHDRLVMRLRAEGNVTGYLCEGRRRDGSAFWFSQNAGRRVDAAAGEIFVGVIFDKTTTLAAQGGVFEIDTAYQSIFNNAGVGIYRSTPEGRQLRANPALVAFNGYTSEAELLAAVEDIDAEWYVEPGRRAKFKALVERDGRIVDFVSQVYRHRTREVAWVRESAWVVRDAEGKVMCYEGMLEDITEQQNEQIKLAKARARARAAEADYRSIFENVDFGVYRTHPDGIQLRVNAALARINGFSTVEEQIAAVVMAGKSGRDWYVDPKRLEEFRVLRARDGYVRNFESEIIRRATGERAWVSEAGWEVRGPDGALIAYEGTVTDITERKMAEAQLRQAKIDAEAASAAKSAFLATMSHELRTPLNAIIGFAEIIADRLFGPNDPRYFSYARDIRASGMHLLALINDILDLSKIAAGRLELAYARIEVAPLLALVAKMFSADAAKAGIELSLECADMKLALEADPMRLQQVLMNLVSNAVKFTPNGGRVTLFAAGDAAAVRIGVLDTGIGMTQAEAASATEPFVQFDAQLTRRHGGTGLGLSICKELVGLHGGTLTIDSAKGQGTRVTAELPLARGPLR
ncbi:MAG: PAS domain-containing sensor histidine kinase [Telmatospirillum sp.]|nr:PAS domain-containing sensor histidine kinase [Telmatospirillum sp.]